MLLIKASKKDFIWSFFAYGLSIGSNILVLPFILFFLPLNEVGLWFTFLSIAMLANLVDFGLSPSILRNTSYIWSGAEEIKSKGITSSFKKGKPNLKLLINIVDISRKIYLLIAVFALVLTLSIGTLYVSKVASGINTSYLLSSWFIFSFGIFLNIAFNFWTPLLKGIGEIKRSQQSLVYSKLVFIIISIILLYFSLGLIGVACAYTLSGFILRLVSKFYFLKSLNKINLQLTSSILKKLDKNLFNKLWFNSWRLGVVSLGAYTILQSNILLCSYFFGLEVTASYGLVIQIFAVTSALSMTPYQTYLPEFNQALSFKDFHAAKRIIILSARSSWLIFITISILIVLLLPQLANRFMETNLLISQCMLVFMSIYLFLETNHSMFSGFIASENKIPFMNSAILSGLGVITSSLILINYTNLGIWSLLISPAIVQLIYNNWMWPLYIFKKYKFNIGNFLGINNA